MFAPVHTYVMQETSACPTPQTRIPKRFSIHETIDKTSSNEKKPMDLSAILPHNERVSSAVNKSNHISLCVGITAAIVSADIANLSASEMLALTTDLRGVCYGNTNIYYGSPRTPEILV